MDTASDRTAGGRIRVGLDLLPESMLRLLGAGAVALLVVHVTLQVLHYQVGEVHWLLKDAFDVDGEENVPTWFSAALLLFSALLLFTIARVKRDDRAADAGYWKGLAIGFVWLSLDEVAGIHEILNTWADELRGDSEFSWAYLGAAVFGIAGLAFVRFLSRLPSRTRNGVYGAGVMYGSGVIGIEIASNLYLKSQDIDTLGYNLLTALEEGLEMAGVIFFIYVLMTYMRTIQVLRAPSP